MKPCVPLLQPKKKRKITYTTILLILQKSQNRGRNCPKHTSSIIRNDDHSTARRWRTDDHQRQRNNSCHEKPHDVNIIISLQAAHLPHPPEMKCADVGSLFKLAWREQTLVLRFLLVSMVWPLKN
jgi:hypothetical protein